MTIPWEEIQWSESIQIHSNFAIAIPKIEYIDNSLTCLLSNIKIIHSMSIVLYR